MCRLKVKFLHLVASDELQVRNPRSAKKPNPSSTSLICDKVLFAGGEALDMH